MVICTYFCETEEVVICFSRVCSSVDVVHGYDMIPSFEKFADGVDGRHSGRECDGGLGSVQGRDARLQDVPVGVAEATVAVGRPEIIAFGPMVFCFGTKMVTILPFPRSLFITFWKKKPLPPSSK